MKYDFDRLVDRGGTAALKWDMRARWSGGDEILPMWVADMDFASPPAVVSALKKRAAHGIYGYTLRPDSYYRAVCGWMRSRFGWEVEKEWIVCTPGVVPALHFAVQAFTRPGDGVIIQPPVYHPFSQAVEVNGRRVVNNPLKNDGGLYAMDLPGLERVVDDRTRLLIFCSPHNPVGRVWTAGELDALAEICLRHELIVVSDEIHADLVLPGFRHTPLAARGAGIAGRTVTCTAPNKTFNIAGLQAGNIVIPDQRLRQQFAGAVSASGLWLNNLFAVAATEAAYSAGGGWLDAMLKYLQGNYEFLADFVAARLPRLRVSPLEGTYLAWIDFRGCGLAHSELSELLLQKAKVWLDQGMQFGPGGEGFFRMNIACPRARLVEALERIACALVDQPGK